MGNTGAFMVRQGPWKYQAFGNALPAFRLARGYTPQLFHVDSDPLEQRNVADANPEVAAALDALLRAALTRGANVVPPASVNATGPLQAVDVFVKRQQQGLYKHVGLSNLLKHNKGLNWTRELIAEKLGVREMLPDTQRRYRFWIAREFWPVVILQRTFVD